MMIASPPKSDADSAAPLADRTSGDRRAKAQFRTAALRCNHQAVPAPDHTQGRHIDPIHARLIIQDHIRGIVWGQNEQVSAQIPPQGIPACPIHQDVVAIAAVQNYPARCCRSGYHHRWFQSESPRSGPPSA